MNAAASVPTFTRTNALVTFGTGVLLPSGDVYSDIALSFQLLNTSCEDYKKWEDYNCNYTDPKWRPEFVLIDIAFQNLFGWIMWIPISINLLFTIPHYLRVEKTCKQRLLAFPFLICLCWPQYRSMRVLWLRYVRHNIAKCLAEKLELEQNVSNLGKKLIYLNSLKKQLSCQTIIFSEPFLEATPQVYMTLILMGQTGLEDVDVLVWASFSISVAASAFGIAKLLKNGPIRLVRKDGKIGGYGTPGFILVMFIVAGNMLGKGTWLAITCESDDFLNLDDGQKDKFTYILIWVLSCFLPQFLLVNPKINSLSKKKEKKAIFDFSDPFNLGEELQSQNRVQIPSFAS